MSGVKPVIYIVDDDKSVRRALKRLMTSAGFEAETFGSAEEFLSSGHQDKPGCLVLDVRMAGMSGIELQKHLATSGSKVPIIFISAHEDSRARRSAMEAGAIAFLQKPFDDHELLNAVCAGFQQKPSEMLYRKCR